MTNDPDDMLGVVRSSPALWARANELTQPTWRDLPDAPRALVVAGVGGSGIVADVVALLADVAGDVPAIACKGYDLPAWCGPSTPVLAVSHSGNTEETLSVATAALEVGAPLAAVTSGGRLGDLMAANHGPVVAVDDELQPRASFALLVGAAVGLLAANGFVEAREALDRLPDALLRRIDVAERWADEAVAALDGRVPVFLGGGGLGEVLALRAKCQVNENAELPAFASSLPEANHNEIVGWGNGPAVPYTLVPLRDHAGAEHPRIAKRFELTAELVGDDIAQAPTLRLPDSPSLLERLAVGVLAVDLLSVHLAARRGVDPTPVVRLQTLKDRMAT